MRPRGPTSGSGPTAPTGRTHPTCFTGAAGPNNSTGPMGHASPAHAPHRSCHAGIQASLASWFPSTIIIVSRRWPRACTPRA
eukprot:6823471-Pyramimonas_sp.AAC.1